MLLILAGSPRVKGKSSNNQSSKDAAEKKDTKRLCGYVCSRLARSFGRKPTAVFDRDYSPLDVAIAHCQGTPLRHEIESRGAARLEEATERAAEALARRFGANAIDGRIRAYVIAAARSMM